MSEESLPQCPICGDDGPDLHYQITRFQVLRCKSCAQIYLYPLLSPEEIREMFAQLYTSGEGSVPELKSYYAYCYDDEPSNPLVQLYEGWLDEIEKHQAPGRLLDVGCGTGLFLSVARRRGWEPFGIDDSEEATRHARDHFGLDVWVGDFKDFPADERRFDVITGWDILEHARKPLEVLAAMRARLAESGLVALSTPNQRNILDLVAGSFYRLTGGRATGYLEKFYIEQHFLYYTPTTLAQALERAGFEVAKVAREGTDLRRLSLSPFMRLTLYSLFWVAQVTGLQTRLFVIGRPRAV